MDVPAILENATPGAVGAEQSIRQRVRASLIALSFWSAILLPFLYLPLLATGLDTTARTVGFLGLLGMHVGTLVVSHSYSPAD